jgi:hypothetical protein
MALVAFLRLWTQSKPILVALVAIALCLLLFRPRQKRDGERQRQQQRQGSASTQAATHGPMVSIATVGTLLEYDGHVPRIIAGAAGALLQIAQRADVYLVTTLPVDSDEVEMATVEAMSAAGLFRDGGCERCKAMFCATEDGRSAMARQLAPTVHVDTSPRVLQYLAPHVPRTVFVHASGGSLEGIAGNLVPARSLADYAAHCLPPSSSAGT